MHFERLLLWQGFHRSLLTGIPLTLAQKSVSKCKTPDLSPVWLLIKAVCFFLSVVRGICVPDYINMVVGNHG